MSIGPSVLPAGEIRTARLTLRRVVSDDAAALFAVLQDWDVVRMLADKPWPITLADAAAYAARQYRPGAEGEDLAVIHDSTLIGVAVVKLPGSGKPPRKMPRLGYWFGREHWGQGYATEALAPVLDHAFRRFPSERIGAGVFRDNPGSKRVLEKLGFAEEGGYDTYCRARDAAVPTADMQLTRAIFESTRT